MSIKASVIIPPTIKPYAPLYTAGYLADIIRKQNINVKIIDANLLFFNHIYNDTINLYTEKGIVKIESKNMLNSINLLKCSLSIDVLDQKSFKKIYYEIRLRNLILNKYYNNIDFRFFDVKLKREIDRITDVLLDDFGDCFVTKLFADFMPQVYCEIMFFTVMSIEQLYFSYIISKIYKNQKGSPKLVIGGPLFALFDKEDYAKLLKYFDCVCIGDAELVFPEILQSFLDCGSFVSNKGIVSRLSDEIVFSNKKVCTINDMLTYEFDRHDFDKYQYYYPINRIPVLTSRECCYGKCLFCTNKGKLLHGCRIKKIDRVLNELIKINSNENQLIDFIDDNIHAKILIQLSKDILARHIDVKWISNTRFYKEYLEYENCKLLYRSGCQKLFIGLESYNQKTLDAMNKGIDAKDVIPILKNFRATGIKTHISVLFGFPGETEEEAKRTQSFIYSNISLIDIVEINCFVNHGEIYNDVALYDAVEMTRETRKFVERMGKDPTYYNILKSVLRGKK